MRWVAWIATIEVSADDAERITDLLWREGTDGVAEVPVSGSSDRVRLMAGFDDEDEAATALRNLALQGTVARVETGAWSNAEVAAVQVGGHELTIESGQAFGHGAHPTTRICLDLLSEHVKPGMRVLDVGTGTGVLAIAAATLGATEVVGIDIDEPSVQVAINNSARNNVASVVDLSTTPVELVADTFDVVVVNMLIADFEPIAEHVRGATDGVLIVSGCLVDQADRIAQATGLEEFERRIDGEWAGVVLR